MVTSFWLTEAPTLFDSVIRFSLPRTQVWRIYCGQEEKEGSQEEGYQEEGYQEEGSQEEEGY